jgi:hypothetical protein
MDARVKPAHDGGEGEASHHELLEPEESPIGGFGTSASRTLAAAPGFLASASASAGSFGRRPFERA